MSDLERKRRRAWANMLTYAAYHRQTVHAAWRKYDGFVRDIGLPPADDYKLHRDNPRDGFAPGNMLWVRVW